MPGTWEEHKGLFHTVHKIACIQWHYYSLLKNHQRLPTAYEERACSLTGLKVAVTYTHGLQGPSSFQDWPLPAGGVLLQRLWPRIFPKHKSLSNPL